MEKEKMFTAEPL